MTEESHVSIIDNDGTVAITGGGTLDLTNSKEFGDGLKHASLAAESVTVDFRPAEFIDTQIVQDLASAAVTMLSRGKRLKVVASESGYPLRVLRISGFQEIMDIEVDSAK